MEDHVPNTSEFEKNWVVSAQPNIFPKKTVLCFFLKQNIRKGFPNIFPLKENGVPSDFQNWEKSHNFPKFELWKYCYLFFPKKFLKGNLKAVQGSIIFPNLGNVFPLFSQLSPKFGKNNRNFAIWKSEIFPLTEVEIGLKSCQLNRFKVFPWPSCLQFFANS